MKVHLNSPAIPLLGICLGLWAQAPLFAAQAQANTKPAGPASGAASRAAPAEIPKSVFVIPATAKEGRNPFFPQSAQPLPELDKSQKNRPFEPGWFTLNGITPNGPKRTCMINSRTFEAGESGEVKLPSGARMLIKCEEIRNDSVIIIVNGERRELRMRFGL